MKAAHGIVRTIALATGGMTAVLANASSRNAIGIARFGATSAISKQQVARGAV